MGLAQRLAVANAWQGRCDGAVVLAQVLKHAQHHDQRQHGDQGEAAFGHESFRAERKAELGTGGGEMQMEGIEG